VAFAMEMSERRACKLVDLDRSISRDRTTTRNCDKSWCSWLGRNRCTATGACTQC
jgi:hypothetical protein